MSTTRRQVEDQFAQELAARLAVTGQCRFDARLWLAGEQAHANAPSPAAARDAAAPLVALCAQCPVCRMCGQWAIVDRYTGIAAGWAWKNGRPRSVRVIPVRRGKSAAKQSRKAS